MDEYIDPRPLKLNSNGRSGYLDGEFFHTGYYHLACDNELSDMCRKIGKFYWCEIAKVLHDHPGTHGWSDETYDKHYRRVYEFDRMKHDRDLLHERSKLLGFDITYPDYSWAKKYPDVPECIDIRKRIDAEGKNVLNVGVGPGGSWLAQQLPHLPFDRLDHIDIHKPYLDRAAELTWAAKSVNFIHKDVMEFDVDGQYDLMLLFDVIEHLPKDKALELLKTKPKKLMFVPIEKEFRENSDGVESQDHKSKWTEQEFRDFGFNVEVIKGFHRIPGGTMDAAWVTS